MSPEIWPEGLGPVLCVVGARPNFMKMAPVLRAFASHRPAIPALLIHTGQHYDQDMNDRLFEDLRLAHPDINLGVGSGTHAVQTAEVMKRFEPVIDELRRQGLYQDDDTIDVQQSAHGHHFHVQRGDRAVRFILDEIRIDGADVFRKLRAAFVELGAAP